MTEPARSLRHMILSYKAHCESVVRLDQAGHGEEAAPHEIAAMDMEKAILAYEIEPGLTVEALLEIMR